MSGLILLNPWVRTEQTLARSYVSNYYSRRIFQRDFWVKLLGGDLNIGAALKSFFETVWKGLSPAAGARRRSRNVRAPARPHAARLDKLHGSQPDYSQRQ